MIRIVYFFTFLSLIQCFSQESYLLSPQDKAYLFHTIQKSPILKQNIGRFVEYNGPEVILPNGNLNYDSIDLIIINNPNYVKIYSDEIKKSSKGIISEVANKQAIWELNKLLQSKLLNEPLENESNLKYLEFEKIFAARLPLKAFKIKKTEKTIHPKIIDILNPGLNFNDKLAVMNAISGLSAQDKKFVIDALTYAINHWVSQRSYEIYKSLGGEANKYINILTAVGDGSSTSGLFEEREKDERGRWNKGLPKAIGLFPYFTELFVDPKRNRESVRPLNSVIHSFETAGNNMTTNIHLDVWGYNTDKQTTVVIEKGGKSYHLFGSSTTRFLSPDSLFSDGMTYYTLINKLKVEIDELEKLISGKKGFDYWIDYHNKRKDGKLLEIDKTEKILSDLRMNPITTVDDKYLTESGKKERKENQDKVVRYYEELSLIKKKIRELEQLKEETISKQHIKLMKLNNMLDLIGRDWVPFKENEGFYTFEDGSTFDIFTQDFIFPASDSIESIELRLIAIPQSLDSDESDEVMLHINVTDASPVYQSIIQINLEDTFESDQFELVSPLFTDTDSISIAIFFEALLDKKKKISPYAVGGGIGMWNGNRTIKNPNPKTLDNYPGENNDQRLHSRADSSFSNLRISYLYVDINRGIQIRFNSYTDPVRSNFVPSESIKKIQIENKLTNNDILSAYRTYTIIHKFNREINQLASRYLSREDAKIVIDRLNKSLKKLKITVGNCSIPQHEF